MSALLLAAVLSLSAQAEPPRPPPPDDEEVIGNLELLERLDLLRHAELVDDGALSEREPPDPAPAPPPLPPKVP